MSMSKDRMELLTQDAIRASNKPAEKWTAADRKIVSEYAEMQAITFSKKAEMWNEISKGVRAGRTTVTIMPDDFKPGNPFEEQGDQEAHF